VGGYLEPGEELRLEARPHGVALVRPLVRALALAAAGGAVVVLGSPVHWGLGALGAVAVALGALLGLLAVWRWDRTAIVLTTEKLFVVQGVLRRRAAAVRLARIDRVDVDQGVVQRALGYGTLIAGGLEIRYVREPRRYTYV
jgi:membrane protein YdbS with pleckstrin-like domain